MADTPTTRNRFRKLESGQYNNAWATPANEDWGTDRLDEALDGVEAYTLSGSKTLTSTNYETDEARMRIQNITGGTGGTVTIPAVEHWYIFRNGSSGTVTVDNGSNTVDVEAGDNQIVFTDGTNIYKLKDLDLGSSLLTTTGTPSTGGHLTTKTYVDATITAATLDGTVTLGANVATFLATPSSANLASALTDETGSGSAVFATSPTLVTPVLGTPSSGTLTSCTGLPISTGVAGLGTGVATFLATPSSANLATAVTDETGSGALVFATSPTLVTPALGTPASGTLDNCTTATVSQADNSTKLASTAYVDTAVAAVASTLTLIETLDVSAGGTSWTSSQIAQTYKFLHIVIDGVSHNGAGSEGVNFVMSGDNGSTWTSAFQATATTTAAGTITSMVSLMGYTTDVFSLDLLTSANPSDYDVNVGATRVVRIDGGCDKVRFSFSSGGTGDAGSIRIYGG